jgi:hypothetical protein
MINIRSISNNAPFPQKRQPTLQAFPSHCLLKKNLWFNWQNSLLSTHVPQGPMEANGRTPLCARGMHSLSASKRNRSWDRELERKPYSTPNQTPSRNESSLENLENYLRVHPKHLERIDSFPIRVTIFPKGNILTC